MNKKKNFAWACDYSDLSGEGNLARIFVSKKLSSYEVKICNLKKSKNFINQFISYKYFSPFYGILICWKNYLAGRNVSYINFLPLWNFFIFLFLPPRTILGPITGGSLFNKDDKINYIIRKYFFPVLYNFSCFILKFRKSKLIFSTSLLKKYLTNDIKKKSEFNFVLKGLSDKIINNKKELSYIIYYRKHKNKKYLYPINFIKKLIKKNNKVNVVGDRMDIKGVKNLGYLNKKKLKLILKKSKYAILSGENIYSLFAVDCINHNVKIMVNKNFLPSDDIMKKNIVKVNMKKI